MRHNPKFNALHKAVSQFIANEAGATAIEYALVCLLVSLAIIPTLPLIASKLNNTFTQVASVLN